MSYSGSNTTHATFNWNPAYDSYKHVALWGNDATGDGTKKYPYRTILKVISISGSSSVNIVLGAGVYRETLGTYTANPSFFADGNVIFDVSSGPVTATGGVFNANGIVFKGSGISAVSSSSLYSTFINCSFEGVTVQGDYIYGLTNCIFKNCLGLVRLGLIGGACVNNTFYNCTNITFLVSGSPGSLSKSVFHTCTINIFTVSNSIKYCDFYNTGVNFGSGVAIYSTYTAFLAAYIAGGGASVNAIFIYFVDPLFNNTAIGDLTLQISSTAKNMASDGTLIGANSIGVSLIGSTTATASAFDNASAINIDIDATSGALTMHDTSINASIVTKPIANLAGRNIASLSTFGFYSDRNGEYIDSTPDLDLTGLYGSGDVLRVDSVYLVDGSGGQITYNGNNYAVGDRFVCRTGVTTFSNTSVAAFAREIIEAPTRNNVEARFSNGTGNFKSNGDALTTDYWYYLTGTATLSGNSYTAGQFIKGDSTTVILSTGTIEEVFTTDAYQYYESFGPLTCNRSGNVFTGAITKGNGDPSFDRTPANVFKIASKYIQIRYTIQANNLTP